MPGNDPNRLRDFYEADYPRGQLETPLLADDDFIYGQVIGQLRPYLRPGLKVLDTGCGIGALSLYMASRGCEVLGVDIAGNAVQAARANAARLGVRGAQFEIMDFATDWHEPHAFDFVLSSFALEHVSDDHRFMEVLASALKPGGHALIFTGATGSTVVTLGRLFPWAYVTDAEAGHVRRYTRASLARVTQEAGMVAQRTLYLDGLIRQGAILCKPLRGIQRVYGLPVLRRIVNGCDELLARILSPGTVAVHALRPASVLTGHHTDARAGVGIALGGLTVPVGEGGSGH